MIKVLEKHHITAQISLKDVAKHTSLIHSEKQRCLSVFIDGTLGNIILSIFPSRFQVNSDILQISCFEFCKPTGALQKVLFNTNQEIHIEFLKTNYRANFVKSFFRNNCIPSGTASYNLCGRSLATSIKCLSFPPMNNLTSVSSSTSFSNCKTTSIVEVASQSGILKVFDLFH